MLARIRTLTCCLAVLAACSFLAACKTSIPPEALALRQESLALRQLQTRRFDTVEERRLLTSAAGLLQDLGFSIDESETALGVIVGSKDRDATEAGQVAGAVVMAVLFGVSMPIDNEQKIRAAVVTRPAQDYTTLRVTFQRMVWDTRGQVSKVESIEDANIYQDFFEKLSKSVFLEAHKI